MFRGHVLIIGAMKAGTTTLHHLLRQHPLIASGRKEPNYFRDAQAPARRYERFFPDLDKSRHAYTLEASPRYANVGLYPDVPARIARFEGNTRLIYILRDPVARADSHVAHNIRAGRWTLDSINYRQLLDVSAYARQLDAYRAAGLREIFLLDFAELTKAPIKVANRVLDHLGLPRAPIEDVGRQNARDKEMTWLSAALARSLTKDLRSDAARLSKVYHFEPASRWLHDYAQRLTEPV